MKKNLSSKWLLLILAMLNAIPLQAQRCKNANPIAHKAKIRAAQFLRGVYLAATVWHIRESIRLGYGHICDQKSSMGKLLKNIVKEFLLEVSSVYCSLHTSAALSNYIKKQKSCNAIKPALTEPPTEFQQETHEDIDKVIWEIVMHSWVVASVLYSCYTICQCSKVGHYDPSIGNYPIFRFPTLTELINFMFFKKHPNENEFFSEDSRFRPMLGYVPFSVPARLYTAYHSLKTIGSKIKNLVHTVDEEALKVN